MNEARKEFEVDPEWIVLIEANLKAQLENFDLFGQQLTVSPDSLTEGTDTRDFPDLNPQEQVILEDILFKELQFDPTKPEVMGKYEYQIPESQDPSKPNTRSGLVKVEICKTGRSGEDMFLHKTKLADGKIDYVIAPASYRP